MAFVPVHERAHQRSLSGPNQCTPLLSRSQRCKDILTADCRFEWPEVLLKVSALLGQPAFDLRPRIFAHFSVERPACLSRTRPGMCSNSAFINSRSAACALTGLLKAIRIEIAAFRPGPRSPTMISIQDSSLRSTQRGKPLPGNGVRFSAPRDASTVSTRSTPSAPSRARFRSGR